MFVTIAEAIGGFLVSVDKALSNGTKFQDWLTDIDSFLEPIHDAVSAACDAILEFLGLGDGIENIDFDKVLSDLVAKVRGFFDSIKNWIKSIFGGGEDNTLSEAVTDQLGVDKLGEDIDFKDAFDTIKEKVLGFFKSVGSWLNGVGKSEGTEMAKRGRELFGWHRRYGYRSYHSNRYSWRRRSQRHSPDHFCCQKC